MRTSCHARWHLVNTGSMRCKCHMICKYAMRVGDKVVPHKVEDVRGAVQPAETTTVASFTVTGADGKPVTLDDLRGDFALFVFGQAKDKELSESKLMRLRDVIAKSGALWLHTVL